MMTRRRDDSSAVESVELSNARADIATFEAANAELERRRRDADVLYNIGTASDGIKLTSLFDRIGVPCLNKRIHRHRELTVAGKIPTTDRVVTDEQLDMIERTLAEVSADAANDDSSRCFKLVMVFYMLVRDHEFRALLLKLPPPPHPFPHSAEALAAAASAPPVARSLVDPEAFIAFMQEDLLPEYHSVVQGKVQRVNLQDWVVERLLAYIVRLPSPRASPHTQ